MSKPLEKAKAVELRRAGLSYREIRQQVPVAKATLSLWLRMVGLSTPQKQRLTAKKLAAARRGWEKLRRERLERVTRVLAEAEAQASELIASRDALWFVGTALYWAEGVKPKTWRPSELAKFTNMDPRMILLMREWLHRYCGVQREDIVYAVQIHERADIQSALRYWGTTLGVPQTHLRVYLKRHNPAPRRKNTGQGYYGTMRMYIPRSTLLNYRIAGWIQSLAKHCGVG